MPDDEELQSQDSGNTSLGSRDSFDQDMGQAASAYGSGVSMNHFMAAYLVPLVKANNKIHDVALHVLNASSDLQDAQTHLDVGHPEDKHALTVMTRENILKVLDLGS